MAKREQFFAFVILATFSMLVATITGCSRDPNVRKQKYLKSAQQYFEKGQNREAMIEYMNALQVDPKFVEAHYGLAQVSLRMGAWNAAFVELSRTIDLQPDHLNAQLDLGHLHLAAHDYKAAMEKADLVLAKDPNLFTGYVLKANLQATLGQKQAALDLMQKAISLAPDHSELYGNMAVLQMNAGKLVEAEANFRKAIELEPSSSARVLALANFYLAYGRAREAEQQYQTAIEVEPKVLAPRIALARFYMQQNRRDQAEEVVREAAALRDVPGAKTVLVDFYAGLGETEKALQSAATLYRSEGKDLAVKEAYVRMLLATRRFSEAAQINEEILSADSKNVNALISKAQIYNNTERPADAIGIVETALERQPDNALGHYVLGVAANLTGDVARAEKEWRQAARLRPTLIEAQQSLANLAVQKGDVDLLASASEELVKAQPSSSNGYVLRALVAANRKEPQKVEDNLQKAIALEPRNALGYTKLGVWRVNQKKYPAAVSLFEQALALDPNAGEALGGLVGIYADLQKNVSRALDRVRLQIERSPSNSGYYVMLAILQNRMQDENSAEASLEKAVELDHKNVDALMFLAQLQAASGRADQAAKAYEDLIRDNPKNINALVALGTLEQLRGNWQRAQSLYEKALLVSPEYPPAANNLAYILLEHGGNLDLALSLAQVARRGMPDSTSTADTLAWAYYNKGLYPLAQDLLEDCVRKAPQNATYQYHLGLVLQKQNERVKARRHLEQVLKLDPKYPDAKNVRQALSELGS
ncbi:MAG: tetratricopeptide repeat protein [Acidobacteriales bacterium]|nr:tetratricopeptide repeat protein [Terriglobales bacterium]